MYKPKRCSDASTGETASEIASEIASGFASGFASVSRDRPSVSRDGHGARWPGFFVASLILVAAWSLVSQSNSSLLAQEATGPQPNAIAAGGGVEAFDDEVAAGDTATPAGDDQGSGDKNSLSLLELLKAGGLFMIPLGLLSIVVVAISIERLIGLRQQRVLPRQLVSRLGQLSNDPNGFDPRQAYKLCQEFPSSAASVIRAMLLKVGRPHNEVEHTVTEASQREAERLHGNVRWLGLSASVAPLVGLLGTVWGMIRAFYDSTQLEAGQNKAEALAEGIYTALVTTLCGLVIAIPAAIIAHYFESRITAMFHRIDDLLFNLLPQIERYEGRIRFSKNGSSAPTSSVEEEAVH